MTVVFDSLNLIRQEYNLTICTCQWLMAGWWFFPGTPISSTNKTDCHDINEIMLKVTLNSITVTPNPTILFLRFSCLVLSFDIDPIFSKFLYDFIDFQPAMVKVVIRNLPVNQMMRSVLVKRNLERWRTQVWYNIYGGTVAVEKWVYIKPKARPQLLSASLQMGEILSSYVKEKKH